MKKVITIIVVLGVIVGIGALFYTGVLDWDQIRNRSRGAVYQAEGVISRSLEGPKGDPKAAAICRENLKRIESAKRQVAAEKSIVVGAVSRDDVARKLGGQLPVCPSGGTYSINELGRMPTCSIGSAGTPDKSDDHAILTF
ncbi:MAG: hypothetical protein Kow0059_09990 [Candidatus Sumerlaeia bacterium]